MLSYFLIGLSLVLLGIVGLQFTYMFYLDRIHLERKKHLHTLERKCADLAKKLEAAEARIAEYEAVPSNIRPGVEDEAWADVLDDR